MKKTIGIVIGIGLLLLSSCAAPTPAPTPTAVPTPTAASITTVEELVGVWRRVAGRLYIQFKGDGTYRVAAAAEALEEHPSIEGEFWFEGGQLFLKDIAGRIPGADSCVGLRAGSYEVQGAVKDYLTFAAIDEPCEFRSGGFTTVVPFTWFPP